MGQHVCVLDGASYLGPSMAPSLLAKQLGFDGLNCIMTRRLRSHVLGDLAVAKLTDLFTEVGWTCEKIEQDYGEDLMVRVFENEKATAKYFFIQSKATDNIERYKAKIGRYRYPFKNSHIESWTAHKQPVLITLYDAKSDRFYWQSIQNYVEHILPRDRLKLRSIIFSEERIINKASIDHINTIVDYRYSLFDNGKAAARILVEALQEHYGLIIDYSSDGYLRLPAGRFSPTEGADDKLVLFGDLGRRMEELIDLTGQPRQEIFEGALSVTSQIFSAFSEGGKLQIRDSDGRVLEEFHTLAKLHEYIAAQEKL